MLPSMGPPFFSQILADNKNSQLPEVQNAKHASCTQEKNEGFITMEDRRVDMTGKIFLQITDQKPLDLDSIHLLEKVAIHGSIARTAREIGISYPKLWHTIENLNKLSDKPLVVKSAGGKGGGGGTTLTEEGRKFLKRIKAMQQTHKKFIRQLEDKWASGK
jgi:molybdate transport system regulatory protein